MRQLLQKLGSGFRLEPQASFETVTGATCHRIRVIERPFLIEIFEPTDDAHAKERFDRRVRIEFDDGKKTWMPTIEDVIITKLRWSRHAKRAKDRDDATNVIHLNADDIDWDYVCRWCDAHGTRAILDEIRNSIPRIDE